MNTDRFADPLRLLLQLLFIGALIAGSFWILRPFLVAFGWATTIVVATWPLLLRVQAGLGGRRVLAVAAMTIVLLLVLIVPLYSGISTVVESSGQIEALSTSLADLAASPPPSWVETIPLFGAKLAAGWLGLSAEGPEALSERVAPHVREISRWLLAEIGSAGAMLIQFLLTVGIAAILYANGEAAAGALFRFARRVGGAQGESSVQLAGQAIQAVALGVVVTAMIQSALAGLGLVVAGVPFAGVLTAVIFVLAVAQLGPALILIPAIGWLYWQGQSAWATALLVWAIPVTALDSFLRPLLIKRGADLPLLLILPGVIGGLIAFGVIGLFIGPVLLAVGYTLLLAWLDEDRFAKA